MPASIFGERFLSREVPAWHRLGKTFPRSKQMTVQAAMKEAGCDYLISKTPLIYRLGDEEFESQEEVIVRHPTTDDPEPRMFGTCKGAYTPLQNMEVAKILDEGLAGNFPVETLGALGEGEEVFISLTGEPFAVKGVDEINSYYVADVNHSPGKANWLLFTPVRVVCQNTLSMGHRQANIRLHIPHISNPKEMMAFGVSIIKEMSQARDKAKLTFNAMASAKMDQASFEEMLRATWAESPRPKKTKLIDGMTDEQIQAALSSEHSQTFHKIVKSLKSWEYWNQECLPRYREGARQRLEAFNDEQPKLANTFWAGWQAITETEDWRDGGKTADYATLFGDRAKSKSRAFVKAVQLIK